MKFGDLVDVELDGRLEYRKYMPADVKDGFPMIFLDWYQDVRGTKHIRFFTRDGDQCYLDSFIDLRVISTLSSVEAEQGVMNEDWRFSDEERTSKRPKIE